MLETLDYTIRIGSTLTILYTLQYVIIMLTLYCMVYILERN